ncbi:hypothetical protein LshimejAT787_0303040 [Lyophyllum shimeji]|uniref:WW domain-containing protein n=1 Tax=Lyophyllum shimeji TaxID=47721 RepID=A0A9P3PIF6_LYOSH|nr:hypothetical protein LshimejAT787_0303040 [Lyophyllum shimeji]
MTDTSERPLPDGWIRQIDQQSGHPFYVDTKADPPRSVWVHPYEDEQYLNEHPEAREKIARTSESSSQTRTFSPIPENNVPRTRKRGFLGKIKDKLIGTKEERELAKRRAELLEEQRRQQWLAQAARAPQLGGPQYGYGQPQYGYGQQQYGYGQPQTMGMGGMGRRRGFGMGGMALPLVGGLAGGLLLGDLLDGDNDYDRGYGDGGGSDGGGDFGDDAFGGGF